MAFKDCVASALKQGAIKSKEHADELNAEYDDLLRAYGDPTKAKQQLIAALEATGQDKLRRALKSEEVRLRNEAETMAYRNAHGQFDPAEAFNARHGHGRTIEGRNIMDAETLQRIIYSKAMSQIAEFRADFQKGFLIGGGLKRKLPSVRARLDDVGRAVLKEKVSDPRAKALADILSTVVDDLRVRSNEAGSSIGKLDYGYIPTSWDAEALMNFRDRHGLDALVERILPELHPDRMVDPLTGQKMTPKKLREAVKAGLENAMVDGFIDEERLGTPMGRGPLFERHAHHRFFHFKDFAAWKRVMSDFGNGDVYAVFEQHIAAMSRDIAHMEIWGPDPARMRTYEANRVRMLAKETPTLDQIISRSQAALTNLAGNLGDDERARRAAPMIRDLMGLYKERIRLVDGAGLDGPNAKRLSDLDQRIDRIEKALVPAADDVATAHVAVEMANVLSELRDPDYFAGIGNPQLWADKQIRRADAKWEHLRGALNTPSDVRVSASFRSFWDQPLRRRFGLMGAALLPALPEGRQAMAEVIRAPFTAEGQASIRNWISAAKLGAAVISALSDPVFGGAQRAFIGMTRSKSATPRMFIEYIKQAASKMTRAEVERAWLAIDSETSTWAQSARYLGTVDPRMWTGYLADRALAIQGLHAVTTLGKGLFVKDVMSFVADNSGKAWGELDPRWRDTLDYHGFKPEDWEQLRGTPHYRMTQTAAGWIRPNEVEAHAGRVIAEKYIGLILRELRRAVPEGDVTSRTHMLGTTRPGTVPGELMRSFAQFKSFPSAIVMGPLRQMLYDIGGANPSRGLSYGGQVIITGTLIGMVTMALKAMKDGKDPAKWIDDEGYLDPAIWGAALLQAGGLGIYGDFLFSNLNRHGGSLPATVAGPAVGWIDDIRQLTIGNIAQAIQGKDTKIGADVVKVLRANSPILNVWWMSLPWNRLVLDQLQIAWDKDAYANFRREASRERKEFRRGLWWERGETSPSRAPDLDVFSTR